VAAPSEVTRVHGDNDDLVGLLDDGGLFLRQPVEFRHEPIDLAVRGVDVAQQQQVRSAYGGVPSSFPAPAASVQLLAGPPGY